MQEITHAPPVPPGLAAGPPPDIELMRETAAIALDPDAVPEALPLSEDEVSGLVLDLVAHLNQLVPAVEQLIGEPTKVDQYCALACAGEARRKLSRAAAPVTGGEMARARRLARVLDALVTHWEQLAGAIPAARAPGNDSGPQPDQV
ncbi:DUF6415 family natural product biosynthesis protein [Streptomyces griseoviridis]